MQNIKYKEYADCVFSYFNGYTVGQGGYYFRYLLSKRKEMTQEEYQILTLVTYTLLFNDYLDSDDGHFLKLSQKGYDYLQDGDLICRVNLNRFVNPQDKPEVQFNTIWTLIGKESTAPFYAKGSIYYEAIRPYHQELPPTYGQYTQSLVNSGQSSSRVYWFRELFLSLTPEQRENFLNDLSILLDKYYQETIVTEASNHEAPENPFDSLTQDMNVSKTQNQPAKKKVFITYCWETDIDPEHSKWVHKLADDLSNDFEIIIDIKQPLGIELNRFMEQTIIHCDKVLIIATPEYKRRADGRLYGVGYETSLITADLVSDQNRIKFIPIIRKGDVATSYPIYLGTRKGLYMTETDDYSVALQELIENLKNF